VTVGDASSIAECVEVERTDVHHRLDPSADEVIEAHADAVISLLFGTSRPQENA
jgi:hypothetical protein